MSEQNRYARGWAERWAKGDEDSFLDLFTDDCRYEDISTGYLCNGKEELGKFYKVVHTASPGLVLQLTESFGAGDDVAMEWVMSGTVTGEFPGHVKGTGKAYSIRGASIAKLKDGKIFSIRDYATPSTQGGSHQQDIWEGPRPRCLMQLELDPQGSGIVSLPGALSKQELLDYYQELSGIEIHGLNCHEVLALFKMAVIQFVGSMLYDDGNIRDLRYLGFGGIVKSMLNMMLSVEVQSRFVERRPPVPLMGTYIAWTSGSTDKLLYLYHGRQHGVPSLPRQCWMLSEHALDF